ncbi:hypothetical protein ABZ942_30230 [Nocardia sp. NPDC046473]|uniref:hypothetical protein n=1 Tax=Nocardia sp. NPDC046473 TaxID=3155733 RepID=UPI00340A1DAF
MTGSGREPAAGSGFSATVVGRTVDADTSGFATPATEVETASSGIGLAGVMARFGFDVQFVTDFADDGAAAIARTDVTIVTLAPPFESVIATLERIRNSDSPGIVLVRASENCVEPAALRDYASSIHCVVGTEAEIAHLATGSAESLVASGVRAVCTTSESSCAIYTHAGKSERPRIDGRDPRLLTDTLAAALALRATVGAAPLEASDVEWALAAATVSSAISDTAQGMADRVDRLVELLWDRPLAAGAGPAGEFVHQIVRHAEAIDVTVHTVGHSGPDSGYAVEFGAAGPKCLVRLHSRCFYGESLGIDGCDCAGQLSRSIDLIQHEGAGVLLYLEQEGRGAGLLQKARAHQLSQLIDRDTFETYELLGIPPDARSYDHAADFLLARGLTDIRLLTNNPLKVKALRDRGIYVTVVRLVVPVSEAAEPYMRAKQRRGHWIETDPPREGGHE